MGFVGKGELLAALYTATFMLVRSSRSICTSSMCGRTPWWVMRRCGSIKRAIETHAEMTSYLTLLLATLGIMIGLFTVTGFINRMGAILIDLGAWNPIAMILMAWVFGWLAGAGLPPTATYIIGAVVIVPPMKQLGIDPWVAHFFVFLLSVWGELSPPTSLTAAVSARIANASFLQDHVRSTQDLRADHAHDVRDLHALQHGGKSRLDAGRQLCLVLISTVGITFAMFGRCHRKPVVDVSLRCLLAAVSFVVMFHPDMITSASVAVVVTIAVVVGIYRHNYIAPPKAYSICGGRRRTRERSCSCPGRGQARDRIAEPRRHSSLLPLRACHERSKLGWRLEWQRMRLVSAGSAPAAWGCPWPSCCSKPAMT